MVFEGAKRDEAADNAGLHRDSLRKAFKRPDVLTYLREQQQALRTSAAARTIAKAEKLMDGAESEHVQADMVKWLAGLEGVSPTQRVDHVGGFGQSVPGLTVNFMIAGPIHQIDGQAHQSKEPITINGLPKSVPHPSMRNVQIATTPPAQPEGPGRHPEGEKT